MFRVWGGDEGFGGLGVRSVVGLGAHFCVVKECARVQACLCRVRVLGCRVQGFLAFRV